MKKIIIIHLFILGVGFHFLVYPQTLDNPQPLFENNLSLEEEFEIANNFYQADDFPSALKIYEKMIQKDNHLPEVYYNLGNTYYKLFLNGNFTNQYLAKSILAYEKAILANDYYYEEAQINLEIIRTANQLPSEKNTNKLFNFLRKERNGVYHLIGISFICVIIFLILTFFKKKFPPKLLVKGGLFFSIGIYLISLVLITLIHFKWSTSTEGIIKKSLNLYSEPDVESQIQTDLLEGSKVIIRKNLGDWVEVENWQGIRGWILEDQFFKITL